MKKTVITIAFIILFLLQKSLYAQNLNGKIVFSTYSMSDDSIWSMNGDGSDKKFITLGNWPRVSPDKRYMAFLRGGNASKARNSMYLRDLIAKHDTLIYSNNDFIVNFDFNDSATELTFDYSCNIYRMNLSTGSITGPIISGGDCWNDLPRLSDDDSLLAFQNLHYGIFLTNYDGSNAAVIPNTQAGDLGPIWSPDKKWISFTRDHPGSEYNPQNYFTIQPDGSNLTQLTSFSDGDTLGFCGASTRDGKYLVFAGRIDSVMGIYQIATGGSGAVKLIIALPGQNISNAIAVGNADTVNEVETGFNETAISSAIKIYPNPVQDLSIIQIDLPVSARLQLKLYDPLGREIQTIADEWSVEGIHSYQLDLHSLSAGLYSCIAVVNDKSFNERIAIVR